mmetsp:Transcript_3049/g.10285  ORF Transcript_3049/g.10285 Transcript_3049/m.10285 type:complete len:89 (+) Transcript_3049:56-322(+)
MPKRKSKELPDSQLPLRGLTSFKMLRSALYSGMDRLVLPSWACITPSLFFRVTPITAAAVLSMNLPAPVQRATSAACHRLRKEYSSDQ